MLLPQVLAFFFLYFPEDKTLYIPAVIQLFILIIIVLLVMRAIIRWSKREEKKAQELEKQLKLNDKDS